MSQFLQQLIPDSNRLDLSAAHGTSAKSGLMAGAYDPSARFIGVFLDQEDQPTWARRAARYLAEEFDHDTPGQKKRFGAVVGDLDDGAGQCLVNCRHALEQYASPGSKGTIPYATQQDFGSCVDASCAEMEATLFGWRVANPEALEDRGERPEYWKYSPVWYKYAGRGYCSDGWTGAGIATVARRVGAAFAINYEEFGADFREDDKNERIVAREWCRRGIPPKMAAYTAANHGYADGAITRFEGGLEEIRAAFATGGVLHTSGTRTSGGSKPFTIGRTGPHMQAAVGCDDSDLFRRFCVDVIGTRARDDDFPVILHQTWGRGWSGECADQYWPGWWGPEPEGAWVWWASDVVRYLSIDFVWLPWVRGFPVGLPVPPDQAPPLTGEIWGEQLDGRTVIRGTITDVDGFVYKVVPAEKAGRFKFTPWGGL